MQDLTERGASAQLLALRARALAATAWLAFLEGDFEGAAPLAEDSLARWRQLGEVGHSPWRSTRWLMSPTARATLHAARSCSVRVWRCVNSWETSAAARTS